MTKREVRRNCHALYIVSLHKSCLSKIDNYLQVKIVLPFLNLVFFIEVDTNIYCYN